METIHRITGDRLFWVKSLKNSTIISCILSVKKTVLRGFDYSMQKREKGRLKELKHRLFHMEAQGACVQLSSSQSCEDLRCFREREKLTLHSCSLRGFWLFIVRYCCLSPALYHTANDVPQKFEPANPRRLLDKAGGNPWQPLNAPSESD